MNFNQGQITKRAPRQLTRLHKHSQSIGALSLGDVAERGHGKFSRRAPCPYEHEFLVGAENLVCSVCGFTKQREDIKKHKVVKGTSSEFSMLYERQTLLNYLVAKISRTKVKELARRRQFDLLKKNGVQVSILGDEVFLKFKDAEEPLKCVNMVCVLLFKQG